MYNSDSVYKFQDDRRYVRLKIQVLGLMLS